MAVVLQARWWWRSYCGPCTVPRWSWRCRGDRTADWSNPRWHCGSFERVQSFRRATAKVRGFEVSALLRRLMPEPRRSWRCHCGLCRTRTAVAPRLRCDGGINAKGPLSKYRRAYLIMYKATQFLHFHILIQVKTAYKITHDLDLQ